MGVLQSDSESDGGAQRAHRRRARRGRGRRSGARQELDSYHDALRKARGEIYAEQELARQEANENRTKLLKAMRARAQEDVNAAKKRIAAEVATARAQVESETPALANQIARAILDKALILARRFGQRLGKMTRTARNYATSLARFGLFFLLAAAPAFAEEAKQSPADAPIGQVFRWINFAIVLGLLIYGFRKALPYFRTHAEEISQKIAEGARAREAAEKRRSEAQAKLANIGTGSRRNARWRRSGRQHWKLTVFAALARAEAENIERAAQAEIAAAERAARLELKALAARLAIERAEALLRQELTPKAESALFRTFVAELEGSAN